MKVAVIFVSLICSAAAFAPAFKPSAGTMALNAAMDGMSGSIDLRGKEFKFDPLNLSETYEPLLPFFREAELRHGRTAMLAVVGFIVPEFVRIPGDMYSFESIPKVVDVHDALLKNGPMYQLLMWIGLWEMVVAAPAINATLKGEREPGDYGWTQFKPKDEARYKKYVDNEMLNGRLAMCAVGGIATQSVISGHGFPYI